MPNQLPPGFNADNLGAAVRKSGFPLQLRVASRLRNALATEDLVQPTVQQEWSYLDRDTSVLRTLDVVAQMPLFALDGYQRSVRPWLDLLIECKQSELPFVFFKGAPVPLQDQIIESDFTPRAAAFPMLAGLSRDVIEVVDPSAGSRSGQASLIFALDLNTHPFLVRAPVYSPMVTKATWGRKAEIEIGGEDVYNGVILPLIKALDHHRKAAQPIPTFRAFHLHLALGICVMDAPMVLVDAEGDAQSTDIADWVRVVRQEARLDRHPFTRSDVYALDCVHADFLETYMNEHVLPFAKEFAARIRRHDKEVATGIGKLTEQHEKDEPWEPRLRPLTEEEFRGLPEDQRRRIPWA